ncbi:hypothetical protein C8Q78DRAFT_1035551 [Trametes maxima]|nr:hypothetical protein C8Q78DRAFT_1035551 [Trametes maxima]
MAPRSPPFLWVSLLGTTHALDARTLTFTPDLCSIHSRCTLPHSYIDSFTSYYHRTTQILLTTLYLYAFSCASIMKQLINR